MLSALPPPPCLCAGTELHVPAVPATTSTIATATVCFAAAATTLEAAALASTSTASDGAVSIHLLCVGSGIVWWCDTKSMQRLFPELLRLL